MRAIATHAGALSFLSAAYLTTAAGADLSSTQRFPSAGNFEPQAEISHRLSTEQIKQCMSWRDQIEQSLIELRRREDVLIEQVQLRELLGAKLQQSQQTVGRRDAKAVGARRAMVAEHSQLLAEHSRNLTRYNQRVAAVEAQQQQYNVNCAGRAYDPSDMQVAVRQRAWNRIRTEPDLGALTMPHAQYGNAFLSSP
ncbi:MAG: hypothetical protein ACPGZP_03445 [Panacagrimonas sp.]